MFVSGGKEGRGSCLARDVCLYRWNQVGFVDTVLEIRNSIRNRGWSNDSHRH